MPQDDDKPDKLTPRDKVRIVVLEGEATKRARAARHARCRRRQHISECEDVPPSFDDTVRALEENR